MVYVIDSEIAQFTIKVLQIVLRFSDSISQLCM